MLDAMEKFLCLQFVEGFPLETELDPPDRLAILPSVQYPHIFKPDLARLLELTSFIIDAAGHRPMLREIKAGALQPVGIAAHIQVSFLMAAPLARARDKLSQVVHLRDIPPH